MPRILIVAGTRPEVVKLAPVVMELRRRLPPRDVVLCSTGQHREMLATALQVFDLGADVDLDLMKPNQTLSGLTADLFHSLDGVVRSQQPDWIMCQGDTTTAMVASMVGYYHRVKVGHVEAGLRTYNRWQPFPEEINRRIADLVADRHFAPTEQSAENLRREGTPSDSIVVTGNTSIDAVHWVAERPFEWSKGPLSMVDPETPFVLITLHRRENFGGPMEGVLRAIRKLSDDWRSKGVQFVFPVHLNPNVRDAVGKLLPASSNVHLLEPIDFRSMVHAMKRATLILTDSGGVQEEAPTFGTPVLVLRETTERPEGVAAGASKLIGTDGERLSAEANAALAAPNSTRRSNPVNPYGDGKASARIADVLLAETLKR
jgi:UDP-N-acetylglucosamine 2-epimerase (non-hydrolysing)